VGDRGFATVVKLPAQRLRILRHNTLVAGRAQGALLHRGCGRRGRGTQRAAQHFCRSPPCGWPRLATVVKLPAQRLRILRHNTRVVGRAQGALLHRGYGRRGRGTQRAAQHFCRSPPCGRPRLRNGREATRATPAHPTTQHACRRSRTGCAPTSRVRASRARHATFC